MEDDNDTRLRKVKSLKKHVECPVCLEVPRQGPIYTCPNGHLVCHECKREMCPTCREGMGANRSLVAAAVIKNIFHDCKFDGCDKDFPLENLEEHEKMCRHRTVICPNAWCKAEISLSKLVLHLREKSCSTYAQQIVSQKNGKAKFEILDPKNNIVKDLNWKVRSYSYQNVPFGICVKKSGENFYIELVMFESVEFCSNFIIEMKVHRSDFAPDTDQSITYRGNPSSIDDMGFGLSIHHKIMEKMILKDGKFKFSVSFSFITSK